MANIFGLFVNLQPPTDEIYRFADAKISSIMVRSLFPNPGTSITLSFNCVNSELTPATGMDLNAIATKCKDNRLLFIPFVVDPMNPGVSTNKIAADTLVVDSQYLGTPNPTDIIFPTRINMKYNLSGGGKVNGSLGLHPRLASQNESQVQFDEPEELVD